MGITAFMLVVSVVLAATIAANMSNAPDDSEDVVTYIGLDIDYGIVGIDILLENNGNETKALNISVYHDDTLIDNCTVTLSPGEWDECYFEIETLLLGLLSVTLESPPGSGNVMSQMSYCGNPSCVRRIRPVIDWLPCP